MNKPDRHRFFQVFKFQRGSLKSGPEGVRPDESLPRILPSLSGRPGRGSALSYPLSAASIFTVNRLSGLVASGGDPLPQHARCIPVLPVNPYARRHKGVAPY